ncbi:MFS transporter [Peribacillus frigoritolerans]|uniref:MFS transporter n=1 Tax=Peribacillus frigoritolerans TaxID=450367 RepID=UPI0022818199|nr:MFS transporter [Peribacillus frigoritolerans]MCY8938939.1 MFS transporter [Peribacillus frigoritolerans]
MQLYASKKRKIMISGLLFVGMILSFFDRVAINVGIIPIADEFHLTTSQTGILISVFFVSYSLMQPLGGWMTDKYGARVMVTVSLFSWSLFTVMTGFAWSFMSLLFIRFLFGLGEGPFYPASMSTIRDNFPEEERGRANSFFLSAQNIGGILGTALAASMVVAFGWRGMFTIAGILGILASLGIWFILKPQGNQEVKKDKPKQKKVALKLLFKIDNIWKLITFKFISNIINYGLITWMPIYLVKEKGVDLIAAGGLLAIPYIFGFLMFNVSGWLLDKHMANREKYLAAAGALLSAIFLFLMSNATSIGLIITYLTLNSVALSFFGTVLYTIIIKYSPKELTGSASGLVTFAGQIAGVVSPLALGLIISLFNDSYNAAFLFLVIIALLGTIVAVSIKNNQAQPAKEYEKTSTIV